jgi:hypothetical protein
VTTDWEAEEAKLTHILSMYFNLTKVRIRSLSLGCGGGNACWVHRANHIDFATWKHKSLNFQLKYRIWIIFWILWWSKRKIFLLYFLFYEWVRFLH